MQKICLNFLYINMICSFHDKCSLTITARIFIDDTFSMLQPLKVKKKLFMGVFELTVLNNMYLVLSEFKKVCWQLASYQC